MCNVIVAIDSQSTEIATAVHMTKEDEEIGAGDQGIMSGYASDESPERIAYSHVLATNLAKRLGDVRKRGDLKWIRPDGKMSS
eukprot:UN10281